MKEDKKMFLKEKSCVVINDGKVVMVSLSVYNTDTGEVFKEVGRATCNLDCDKFDFEKGLKIAKARAMIKVSKKVLKEYVAISKTLRQKLREVDIDVRRLQGLIENELEVIER
jgi:hypothetical protein